jgi:lysozyme
MKISDKGLALIKHFESLRLVSYQDSVGIWTIGYGITHYESGEHVRQNESLSEQRVDELLSFFVDRFSEGVTELTKHTFLMQCQFDALVSFAYNLGLSNLKMSTLLRKIKNNPSDNDAITVEFLKWDKAKGKVLAGLTRRRKAEAWLYCNNELKFEI